MDRKTKRDMDRLLAGGKLSGPEADEILDRIHDTLERQGHVPPTVLEVSCQPGALTACPSSSTLVFSSSGYRAQGFLSAYAAPVGFDAAPVFYFSEEDGSPAFEEPAKGARSERTLSLAGVHRPGRYRLHAFLADSPLGRDEMLEGAVDVAGVAVRLQVELVIVD